jgi:hypothetical protein
MQAAVIHTSYIGSLGECVACKRSRVPLFFYKPADMVRYRLSRKCALCTRGMLHTPDPSILAALPSWAHLHNFGGTTIAKTRQPPVDMETPAARYAAAYARFHMKEKDRCKLRAREVRESKRAAKRASLSDAKSRKRVKTTTKRRQKSSSSSSSIKTKPADDNAMVLSDDSSCDNSDGDGDDNEIDCGDEGDVGADDQEVIDAEQDAADEAEAECCAFELD